MDDEMAAWAVARVLAGLPAPEPLPELEGAWQDLFQAVLKPGGGERLAAFRVAVAAYPNAEEIERAILAMDLRTPPSPQERVQARVFAVEAPLLPVAAQVEAGLAEGVGRWLYEYVDYAMRVSPLTPRIFHESAGLWLGSLAIARRAVLRLSHKDLFPNLMFLWVAPTTLYAKSTGLNVARGLTRKVMKHLLLPSEMSPEEMVSEMAGAQPTQLALEAMDDWTAGRNYAGQRGIVLDEASSLFVGMKKDYNIGLAEALMRLYDCEPEYVRQTRSAGRTVIRKAYFTFLGATTPRALQRADLGLLWFSGLWPRFCLVTADELPTWQLGTGQVSEPASLLGRLKRLVEDDLPVSTYNEAAAPVGLRLGEGVWDRYVAYFRATSRTMLEPPSPVDDELFGVYGRLAEQALKQAMILAVLDWGGGKEPPTVGLGHWARGQELAERWRVSCHRLVALFEHVESNEMEDRVLVRLKEAPGGLTLRELYRAMNMRRAEVEGVLNGLVTDGVVEAFTPATQGAGRPAIRYRVG